MKIMRFLLATILTLSPALASGQTTASAGDAGTPVYRRGNTFLESAFPPSPEAASVVKYADIPFVHSTGAAMLEIPFHTLKGKELEIPVGLSYVSGGIRIDEIAGVAGLGWTFEAGGCITRTVMDMPDEFRSVIMSHQLPSEELLAKLDDESNRDSDKINYLTRIVLHRVDSRLDRYSYNVCGLSGSFVIRDDGSVFQLSGSGVRITYTRNSSNEITSFTIVGPDGTVYRLSETEKGFHDGTDGRMPDITSGEQDKWEAVTAWYISSVTSRSGLEQAVFSYESGGRWERRLMSKSTTATISDRGDSHLSYSSSISTIVRSYDTRRLTSVTLDGETIRFYYKGGTGSGLHQGDVVPNYPSALSYATVSDINGRTVKRLDFGTGRDAFDGRIILNSLTFRGLGGQVHDRWTFSYDTRDGQVSYNAQDWYGYYNGRSSGFADYAPYHYSSRPDPSPAPGTPDASQASYMSLVRCDHNGAVTEILYEGNAIDGTSIGIRVHSIISGNGSPFSPDNRIRTFRYESPFADGPRMPVPHMYTTVSAPFTTSDMNTGSVTWSFMRHETPVVKGPSVRDTKVYYGKVTEMLSSSHITFNPEISKTVRYYDTSKSRRGVCSVAGRFPESARSRYRQYPPYVQGFDPYDGIHTEYTDEGPVCAPVLTRLEEYAGNGGQSRLVSATDYAYDAPSGTPVLVDYIAEMAWHPFGIGNVNYDYIFHYPVYAYNLLSRQKVSETRVRYHTDGSRDSTVVSTAYLPRSSTLEIPSRESAVSTVEALVTRKTAYTYADGTDEPYAVALKNQRYLSSPLARTYTVSSPVLSEAKPLEKSVRTDRLPWHPGDTAHIGELATLTTLTLKEKTEFGYPDSLPNTLLPSSRIEYVDGKEAWREDILSRDGHGNILQVKEKGRPNTVILWGYGGKYPVAVIENATLAEVSSALGDAGLADTLRALLPGSHVTTFTFDPGIGLASVTDASGVRTDFEYDFAGRLAEVRDADGYLVRDYVYDLLEEQDGDGLLSVLGRIYRSADGSEYSAGKSWWSTMGVRRQDISMAASGDGRDLVTVYESDFLLHDDVKTWLPFPVQDTGGDYQEGAERTAATFHGNPKAYFYRGYEISGRDRVLSTALPGYEGEHENTLTDSSAIAFPKYMWGASGVSGGSSTYRDWEVVRTAGTDADGRTQSVFKDHAGRIFGTSRGDDSPTYYVYDNKDRLRAVAGSGIALTDTLNMWRYSYDNIGRLSSKGIPGSIREHYTYDGEDRIVSVRKGDIEKEIEYDAFGRVVRMFLTAPGQPRELIEEHFYDAYPAFDEASPFAFDAGTWSGPVGNLETFSRTAMIDSDGSVAGYAQNLYLYDSKARPVKRTTAYPDGGILREELTYNFPGEVTISAVTYSRDGLTDTFTATSDYDLHGRVVAGSSTLAAHGCSPVSAATSYHYDVLGRPAGSTTVCGGITMSLSDTYTLQGWKDSLRVFLNGEPLFEEILCYDNGDMPSPSYTGLITKRQEGRRGASGPPADAFLYDHAGRLSVETKTGTAVSGTEFSYDGRGNIVSLSDLAHRGEYSRTYSYTGDVLNEEKVLRRGITTRTFSFVHDSLGRMTGDGRSGRQMEYNHMDLPSRISSGGSISVKYSYLADGIKTSSLTESGEGLVYRGPFTYRRSADGSLALESVVCAEGRLTPERALLYVRDHLGSVRSVVDGVSGAELENSDYSAYGTRTALSAPHDEGVSSISLRDHFTGQDDQMPDFDVPYSDHGARLYSPDIRRWLTPDPLSEKYYGLSVYGYCAGNPLSFIDRTGLDIMIAGANQSSVVVKTDLINYSFRLENIGINLDFGGNFTFAGDDILSAALDIVGILEPTGTADALNASFLFAKGDYFGAVVSGIGVVPYIGDLAKATRIGKDVRVIRNTVDAVKFTKNNFRRNLSKLTGIAPEGMQAHHIFPQAMEDHFSNLNINIHDPMYGTWLDSTKHLKGAHKYNDEWKKFWDNNPDATTEEVINKAKELMKDIYGEKVLQF